VKQKVFLFGPYPPPYGGVATYLYRLNELFEKSNIQKELRIYRGPPFRQTGDVGPTSISLFKSFHALRQNDICFDSCSFFFEYPSSASAFICWLWLKRTRGFRWIKVFHDATLPHRYSSFSFFQKALIALASRLVDTVVAVNDELKSWLPTIFRNRNDILVIPSLLPIPSLLQVVGDQKCIPQGAEARQKIVCSIGVFTPAYGFDQIADAAEALREHTGIDLGLVLIDGMFCRDEAYRSSVLTGRDWIYPVECATNERTLEILRNSDLFVRGPSSESLGLSRIEALWCGTPVVATNVGEVRGMLTYKFGDLATLERQMHIAISDPGMVERVGAAGELFRAEAENNLAALVRLL